MRQAILILILVGCATNDLEEERNGVTREHDPDGSCPGGSTGGGEPDPIPEADPHPVPAPKDWNVDKVWGERCRRIPRRDERRRCWEDAEARRAACYLTCPILTIEAQP
jgi:hypothetical protein